MFNNKLFYKQIHGCAKGSAVSNVVGRELDKVYSALQSNGYPSNFIYDIQTKKPNLPQFLSSKSYVVKMFFKLARSPHVTQLLCVSIVYQRCH